MFFPCAGDGLEDPRARRASRKSPRRRITVTTPPLDEAAMAAEGAAPAPPETPRTLQHALTSAKRSPAAVEQLAGGGMQQVGL